MIISILEIWPEVRLCSKKQKQMHNTLAQPLDVQSASIAQLKEAVLSKTPLIGIICFGTHYRPDIDELASIALIQINELGSKIFPNLAGKDYLRLRIITEEEVRMLGEDAWYKLLRQGCLAIGIAGGPFDDHNLMVQTSATQRVAEFLEVHKKPWLRHLLNYINHEDNSGKRSIPDGYSGVTGPKVKATWRLLEEDGRMDEMVQRAERDIKDIKLHLVDQKRFEREKKQIGKRIRLVPIKGSNEGEDRLAPKIAVVESDSERASAIARYLYNKSHNLVLIVQIHSKGNFQIHSAKEGGVSTEQMDEIVGSIRLELIRFINRKYGRRIRLEKERLAEPGTQKETFEIHYYRDANKIFNGSLTQKEVPGLVGDINNYPFTVNSLVELVVSSLGGAKVTTKIKEGGLKNETPKDTIENGREVIIEISGGSSSIEITIG